MRHPTDLGSRDPLVPQAGSFPVVRDGRGHPAGPRVLGMKTDTTPSLTVPAQGPLDGQGRLLHEGDVLAQLVLAAENLGARLSESGLGWADVTDLRVEALEPPALEDAVDAVREHLRQLGSTPAIDVVRADSLALPGMAVAVGCQATPTTRTTPPHHPTGRDTKNVQLHTAGPAERLPHRCPGFVHLPGEAEYAAAATPWNVAVVQRPAAVALPRTPQEVQALVRAASALGLRVSAQTTGHAAGVLGDLDDVVLVRTSHLQGVGIDVRRRVARVGAGVAWEQVVEAAAEHGLATPHGSAPDIGVVGYSLGGGLGGLARKHGLAASNVTAIELVTADGRLVRADARHQRKLFWALRGGGGSFGVVTAIEVRLQPIADAYAGMLLWSVEHLEPVLRAWNEWTRTAPEEATTSLRVLRFPPLPELPPFLSGRTVVVVDGVFLTDDGSASRELAPLRDLDPEMDTFARVPMTALPRLHMDPEQPTPSVGAGTVLGGLDEAGIRAFVDAAGPDARSSLLISELRQLGGAVSRPAAGGGVLSHVPGAFVLLGVAVAAGPEATEQGRADAEALLEAMGPWANGRSFLNFAERPVDPSTAFDPKDWARLCKVRAKVDPSGVFRAAHEVPRG